MNNRDIGVAEVKIIITQDNDEWTIANDKGERV